MEPRRVIRRTNLRRPLQLWSNQGKKYKKRFRTRMGLEVTTATRMVMTKAKWYRILAPRNTTSLGFTNTSSRSAPLGRGVNYAVHGEGQLNPRIAT